MTGDWQGMLSAAFIATWLIGAVRLAVPILLAALGELINQRSGIINLGLEGVMLLSSLVGFIGSFYTGSAWLGTLAGILTGLLSSLFLAWLYVTVRTSQVIVGFVFNIFVIGLTTLAYRAAFGLTTVAPVAKIFSPIPIPYLVDIPFIGPILFNHHILVYLSIPLMIGVGILLYRSKLGLKIRAVGEYPEAADTAGVNVSKIRYICMAIAGGFQGLAGASLVLGQLGIFRDNVTAGRGFIALAIVIFGRWNPYLALVAAVIFGAADSLAMSLQIFGSPIPPQFLLMLPYVVAALAMSGAIGGRLLAPSALGQPYSRE